MGKGSNVQKSMAARERNLKDKGKTDEERKAAKAKADADKQGYKCACAQAGVLEEEKAICLATFLISSTPGTLFTHVKAKHEKEIATPEKFFPHLKGYDPNAVVKAPEPEKRVKKVEPKKKDKDNTMALLSEGLSTVKVKK